MILGLITQTGLDKSVMISGPTTPASLTARSTLRATLSPYLTTPILAQKALFW